MLSDAIEEVLSVHTKPDLKFAAVLAASIVWLFAAIPASAADPGEVNAVAGPSVQSSANSLTEFKTIVGKVELSEDACGTNTSFCTVDIVKPSASATVREADLFCATTPFNYTPQDGDVTVNGVPVAWDQLLSYAFTASNTGVNARDDVTSIVKPVGDAAPPGLVSFTITENPTSSYDGCALKVIWDDPTTTVNSILIFFGHQESAGDTFVINFAQPLDANAFLAPLEFSLGISFGFQGDEQFSRVDVNGMRLTTSAGGQDDGQSANGALITLGGTGDTPLNPPPMAPPITPSVPDDELYDLRPFVDLGDTSMTIFTVNPSNDDNILLANLFLRNVTVVTPSGPATLTLAPKTATNQVGNEHCVTATVTDDSGAPVTGITVNFSVSGANTAAGAGVTDTNGQAQFCYTGTHTGDDTITATAVGGSNPSDTAAKTWTAGPPATLVLTPPTATNVVDAQHCVTATVKDQFGNPTPGIVVRFSVTGSVTTTGQATTNAAGEATFCYTGPGLPGADVITAYADTNGNGVQDQGEPSGRATKTWVLPASTAGCKVTDGGRITAANLDKATFGSIATVSAGGTPSGAQEYRDHGATADLNVHSTAVLAVSCSADGTKASVFGTARINGSGSFDYRIDLTDTTEPGVGADKYRIRLSTGYDSGEQTLIGGNIQIH
jgi:Big-like domain-containing protein